VLAVRAGNETSTSEVRETVKKDNIGILIVIAITVIAIVATGLIVWAVLRADIPSWLKIVILWR
jgi:hypothetical protein